MFAGLLVGVVGPHDKPRPATFQCHGFKLAIEIDKDAHDEGIAVDERVALLCKRVGGPDPEPLQHLDVRPRKIWFLNPYVDLAPMRQ